MVDLTKRDIDADFLEDCAERIRDYDLERLSPQGVEIRKETMRKMMKRLIAMAIDYIE